MILHIVQTILSNAKLCNVFYFLILHPCCLHVVGLFVKKTYFECKAHTF